MTIWLGVEETPLRPDRIDVPNGWAGIPPIKLNWRFEVLGGYVLRRLQSSDSGHREQKATACVDQVTNDSAIRTTR